MARIKKGILGAFSGKCGTVVGSKWKDKDVMRSLPIRSGKPPTISQEAQQAKFKLAMRFANTMRALLKLTYRDITDKMQGTNGIISYTLKNALYGEYPNLAIKYSYVLVARGDLPNVEEASASSPETGKIHFNWADNTGRGIAKKDDKAILVVYCEELQKSMYKEAGALRSDGLDEMKVTEFIGKTVQTWLSFISENKKDIAPSIFTGEVTVAL